MGYGRLYFLKKAYAIYPGLLRPSSARILQPHYRRLQGQRRLPRVVLDLLVGLGFHAWIPWRAGQVARRLGLGRDWRRHAVSIARARFVDPQDIALFRIGEAQAMDGYIRRFEDAALNKRINPKGWSAGCALADKIRFHARCRAAGLPHPETVAVLVDGRLAKAADPRGRELIAKPADGEGGDGLQVLGRFADGADLAARLPAGLRARRGATVIQPRIAVHAALAELALNALPTVRVVTILNEAGAPEVVGGTLRFAADPEACVDNMKAGGLIAPVDLASGVLGPACKGYGGGDHARHPVTGATITGRVLPQWPAIRALCVRAHATAFDDYALVGWDIAMTPEGPMLIEGNGKPSLLLMQRAARHGLGEGRYGVLLAHHLAMKA